MIYIIGALLLKQNIYILYTWNNIMVQTFEREWKA